MEFNPELPLILRDDVKMIRRNVELEAKLIDDLLDLSRITNGKLRLTFDLVGINDLLRQACETCRGQIQEKGIHLHCEVVENAGDVVGDAARLQQVFWNLLNNAAKFTPEGGHIYVNAKYDGASSEEAQVRVTVRDTGRGIAPEILPHIFNAFEQGEVRITRQFGGMGLGLAICKALVEQHRGSIRAETDGPGKGSTFIVQLPALSREQPATTAQGRSFPRAMGSIAPLRLLIVEDHADTARVLSRLLRGLGHAVTTARTGTAALALAAAHPFDMVISDLGLPDMTGHDLMKQLKREHGIKGIAMSGYGMEEDTRKSAQAGFSDHLVKPVNFLQLEASIGRVAAVAGDAAAPKHMILE
jgi:CheY-like chemotaxis protein